VQSGHLDDLSAATVRLYPKMFRWWSANRRSELVADTIRKNKIDTILHFAAKGRCRGVLCRSAGLLSQQYGKAQSIIQVAVENGVRNFILSSTAAVYGQSDSALVDETAPLFRSRHMGGRS